MIHIALQFASCSIKGIAYLGYLRSVDFPCVQGSSFICNKILQKWTQMAERAKNNVKSPFIFLSSKPGKPARVVAADLQGS